MLGDHVVRRVSAEAPGGFAVILHSRAPPFSTSVNEALRYR